MVNITKSDLAILKVEEKQLDEQSFSCNANSLPQRGFSLERERINVLLEEAIEYPVTIVCAGSGYGKTVAVYSFLQNLDGTHTNWVQLTERDNMAVRFWESYVGTTGMSFPENAKRLTWIGFPDTETAMAKYEYLLRDVEYRPGRFVVVFDDFHLLHDKSVLAFFDRVLFKTSTNTKTILVSRTMPDINIMGLLKQNRVFIINEDDLCFTKDEIDEYFRQIPLSIPQQDIQNIYDDTQGWAFAVDLIGRSLSKEQKYERYALEAMKKNIFRLIEAEVSKIVSEPMLNFLLRISLIDNLAANLIKELADDDELIKGLDSLNSYVRYDFNMDTYLIHHLFLEYLRQNQHMLTDEEKRETYKKAALWCDKNNYHMDALSYFEKSGDYSALLAKISQFDAYYLPSSHDIAVHMLEMLERAPEDIKTGTVLFPLAYFKLKIVMGRYEGTEEEIKKYVSHFEAQPESSKNNLILSSLYGTWGLLRRDMSTYSDVYDFDILYKKMADYYDKSPFPATTKHESTLPVAWATLVGTKRAGALDEYADVISRCIPHTSRVFDGLVVGYDDLIRGETCFYRGDFGGAEQYLNQAIGNALSAKQYMARNRALIYLMRIALIRGDYTEATAKLKEVEEMTECKDFDIRFEVYDIARGFYQLAMDKPEGIQEWLRGDFSQYTHPSFMENYGNRIKAQYHYQTRQYNLLLAYINNERERQGILYGKIELNILEAVTQYKLKRPGEALKALTRAYELSEPNEIITPFILLGKDMRTLTLAAIKDRDCKIPEEWLKNINRKSSAYAKRKAALISAYISANKIGESIMLTKREIEVIKDMAQGLSRSEIAASQNISVNTVKMVVNIIYEKLGANNLLDIVRVATEKKII